MNERDYLAGKRVLVVDDEPDIIESLVELLDMCQVDQASDFERAQELLDTTQYDAAILDIMGVRGYSLLDIAKRKNIPTLMLTAHALSPDHFVKSLEGGALAYIPKDKLSDIATFLMDILEAHEGGEHTRGKWYRRLESFFEDTFGYYWKEKAQDDPEFWKKYI